MNLKNIKRNIIGKGGFGKVIKINYITYILY